MSEERQQVPPQEKPWIVVADDQEIEGKVLFVVRHATSASKACEQIQEEYRRNGWDTPANTTAYRLPKFLRHQTVHMIGKIFS